MSSDTTVVISLNEGEAFSETFRQHVTDAAAGAEVRMAPLNGGPGQRMPTDLMRGATALYCEYPPANFDDFDCLQWMQITSAEYEHLRDFPLVEKGVRVSNGLGTFDIPIAEWNIMMMLAWHRRLLELLANQREKRWDRGAQFQHELRGSTVGLLGYGGIARETARFAKGMGLNVHVLTRDGSVRSRDANFVVPGTGDPQGALPDRVFAMSQLHDFLKDLDYLVITVPLTDATRGLIGERELRALKSSAVLLNPARGPIIEEQALIQCMRESWIRGASLDAQYAYPLPPEHPLWSMPNVMLTPHISGHSATARFWERSCDLLVTNLKRFMADQPLLNELTSAQLQGKK